MWGRVRALRSKAAFARRVFSSKMATKPDQTTQSNYQDISTEHIDIDWSLDFNAKTVSGTVKHNLIAKKDGVQEVV
jgi:leukotriene-A4 hydrolase